SSGIWLSSRCSMPTCFKTSSDFPVGIGPTGGCAYCALAREGKRQKAKSRRQRASALRSIPPRSTRPPRVKLKTLNALKLLSDFCLLLLTYLHWCFCSVCWPELESEGV